MALLRPVFIALAAAALLAPLGRATAEELIDGIAAQVGSEIVLVSEVRDLAGPAEEQMRAAGAGPTDFARLRAEVLESLVERALIRQLVTRNEIGATDEEVNAAIAAIAKENGLSLDQIRESVTRQGLGFDEYRDKIRSEIEHTKVVNGMVASRVRIDEAEIRAAYAEQFAEQPVGGTQVHLRHLLVPVRSKKPAALQASCAKVREARARIQAGTPFGEVAAQISPVNPREGGDIGWMHREQLAPWMTGPIASLSAGETSEVIKTPFGCNLLQLVERRDYTPISFEQARGPLRQQLFEERMRLEYSRFVERLRGQTYIERKGFFADAARLGGPQGGPPAVPSGVGVPAVSRPPPTPAAP